MRLQKQKFRHRPEQGEFGDCSRTALACILNLDRDDVPNFGEHYADTKAFTTAERAWLGLQGYTSFLVALDSSNGLEGVLQATTGANKHAPCLLTGTSRTGVNHVVIAQDGEIIHDPSLDDAGIVGPAEDGYYWLEVIVPLRYVAGGDRSDRADFEAFYCQGMEDAAHIALERRPDGEYAQAMTRLQWKVWQASRARVPLADADPYYAARYRARYARPSHDGDAPSERARS